MVASTRHTKHMANQKKMEPGLSYFIKCVAGCKDSSMDPSKNKIMWHGFTPSEKHHFAMHEKDHSCIQMLQDIETVRCNYDVYIYQGYYNQVQNGRLHIHINVPYTILYGQGHGHACPCPDPVTGEIKRSENGLQFANVKSDSGGYHGVQNKNQCTYVSIQKSEATVGSQVFHDKQL